MHNGCVTNSSDAPRPRTRRSSQGRLSSARTRAHPPSSQRTSTSGNGSNPTSTRSAAAGNEEAKKKRNLQRRQPTQPTSSAPESHARLAALWHQWKPHVKRFGPPLLINHAVSVGIIVALAAVVGIGTGFSRVPATIGSLWMVLNLGSLTITGAQLGFLPLLPAMILVFGHARRITSILGTSVSMRGLRICIVLGLAIPLLLTLIAWLMLWDASHVFDLTAPNLADALVSTALVHGTALVLGLRPRIWRALLLRKNLPTWPVESFRLAFRFLSWMFAAGVLAVIISTLANTAALMQTYHIASTVGAKLGLSALALLYVPNIAIGAVAVLLGGEFHVGNGTVTLFTSTNISLPPLPAMAAIVRDPIPGGPLYFAIPAIVAVGAVYRYVRSRNFIEAPIATALGSGAAAAFLGFCLSWLAGGQLGVYGSAGALEWLFAAEAAAWLILPACAFMIHASRAGTRVMEDVEPHASEGSADVSAGSAHTSPASDKQEAEPLSTPSEAVTTGTSSEHAGTEHANRRANQAVGEVRSGTAGEEDNGSANKDADSHGGMVNSQHQEHAAGNAADIPQSAPNSTAHTGSTAQRGSGKKGTATDSHGAGDQLNGTTKAAGIDKGSTAMASAGTSSAEARGTEPSNPEARSTDKGNK